MNLKEAIDIAEKINFQHTNIEQQFAMRKIIEICRKLENKDRIIKAIETVIINEFNLTFKELKIKTRNKRFILPRQIACYLIRENTDLILAGIGEILNVDYSTVFASVKKIKNNIETYNEIRSLVEYLNMEIKEQL